MPVGETFVTTKYQSDAGGVYSIRLSNDFFLAAPNTSIAAAYTDKRVQVTSSSPGNKRKSGLHARGFVIGLPATAPDTGYIARSFMPITLLSGFNGKNVGDTVLPDGETWEIIDKIGEA